VGFRGWSLKVAAVQGQEHKEVGREGWGFCIDCSLQITYKIQTDYTFSPLYSLILHYVLCLSTNQTALFYMWKSGIYALTRTLSYRVGSVSVLFLILKDRIMFKFLHLILSVVDQSLKMYNRHRMRNCQE